MLADESVDLILTDPPYNTGLTARTGSRLKHFFDDAMSPDLYRELVRRVSLEMFRVLRPDRAVYVFINWKSLGIWLDRLVGAGFRVKNTIVWDKVVHGLNYQNYAYRHELLIFATKGKFFPRNKGWSDGSFTDVWPIKRETRAAILSAQQHETVKPFEVLRRPIEHASQPGDLILDPFAGSGSTCVAAKRLGRHYLGIELDETYCALAERRLASDELKDAFGVEPRNGHIPCSAATKRSRSRPARMRMRRKSRRLTQRSGAPCRRA